jgi:hypothetical protein
MPHTPQTPGIREMAKRLEEIIVWGVQRGWDLLDSPVNIFLTWDNLGYTHPSEYGTAVEIFVNPNVLRDPRGEQLLKALILHELGHHLAHFRDPGFKPTSQQAKLLKLRSLFNLIEDEHLERQLRSMNPQWGECLDALVARVFKGEPAELGIEEYASLMGLSAADARRALLDGTQPGTVTGFEFGYLLGPEYEEWISYPEFLDRVFEELGRRHPRGTLPEDLQSHWTKLKEWVATKRSSPEGIDEPLRKVPLFNTIDHRLSVRSNVSDLLDPLESEAAHPERYLRRLRAELRPILAAFPRLDHYVQQLERSRHSIWFWSKQRCMLFMLRRGRDFVWAFDEASSMSPERIRELLGRDLYSPGLMLEALLSEWKPRPHENRDWPLRVRLRWIDALQSPTVASLTRFTVSLRLGLAHGGVSGDAAAEAALQAIPKKLRMLDAGALLQVTTNVADALGREAVQDEEVPVPVASEDDEGEPAAEGADGEAAEVDAADAEPPAAALPPPAAVLNAALEKQRSALRQPAKRGDDPALDDALARARREASRRIDHWLRTGVDAARPIDAPTKHARRARPGRFEKIFQRRSSLDRAAGSAASDKRIEADLLNMAAACGFDPIPAVGQLQADKEGYALIAANLRAQIRILRRYFLTLGTREEEEFARRSGRRVDMARLPRLAVLGDPAVVVGRHTTQAPDLFVGVAIDCSGSMMAETRMDKAKSFGTLILESARRVAGISAHVVGFTDDIIYDVGEPGDTSITRLEADGGNNDAAGLLHAARFALASMKSRKLLVMISDGYPTECSFESLCRLVEVLDSRHGICCAQVAVDSLDDERIAFPHFTDLTEHTPAGAVAAFGRMIQHLIRARFGLEG